jgi:hypothetical protein
LQLDAERARLRTADVHHALDRNESVLGDANPLVARLQVTDRRWRFAPANATTVTRAPSGSLVITSSVVAADAGTAAGPLAAPDVPSTVAMAATGSAGTRPRSP